jgi:hypothetical protein
MKIIRRNQPQGVSSLSSPLSCHEIYFFLEKNTGASRFHVEAGPDGKFPVEEAAGLLAMHCMVLGQTPQDYVVLVQAAEDLLGGLAGKVGRSSASRSFRRPPAQVDTPPRRSTEWGDARPGQQGDCRFAESVRAHREVPPIGIACKVLRAWTDGVGPCGHAPYPATDGRGTVFRARWHADKRRCSAQPRCHACQSNCA